MFLLLLSFLAFDCVTATEHRTSAEDVAAFDRFIPANKPIKAGNLGGDKTVESVRASISSKVNSYYVGVVINIRNYSPYLLTDPKYSVTCGYRVI